MPLQRGLIHHDIAYRTAITVLEIELDIRITTANPYLALTSELWGVYWEDFGEKWPHYKNTALYNFTMWMVNIYIYTWQSDTKTKWRDANSNIPHIKNKMLTVSNFYDQYYMYLKSWTTIICPVSPGLIRWWFAMRRQAMALNQWWLSVSWILKKKLNQFECQYDKISTPKNMFEILYAKWRPFCFGANVLGDNFCKWKRSMADDSAIFNLGVWLCTPVVSTETEHAYGYETN